MRWIKNARIRNLQLVMMHIRHALGLDGGDGNKQIDKRVFNNQRHANKSRNMCSPSRRLLGNRGGGDTETEAGDNSMSSCFNMDELRAMADAYNLFTIAQKNGSIIQYPNKMDHAQLWNALREKLLPLCGDRGEVCWLDQSGMLSKLQKSNPFLYDLITKDAIKPQGKRKKYEWLNTLDIERVMTQYETVYPQFKFIGCFASDHFELNPREFPSDIIKKYRITAIVFNMDASHQSGSHWISVVFSRDEGRLFIEYFDSTGSPPNQRIKKFLSHPFFHDAIYIQNATKHQKYNSECGVYSMYFILQRLMGKTLDDINKNVITDRQMNEYRCELFRPYDA